MNDSILALPRAERGPRLNAKCRRLCGRTQREGTNRVGPPEKQLSAFLAALLSEPLTQESIHYIRSIQAGADEAAAHIQIPLFVEEEAYLPIVAAGFLSWLVRVHRKLCWTHIHLCVRLAALLLSAAYGCLVPASPPSRVYASTESTSWTPHVAMWCERKPKRCACSPVHGIGGRLVPTCRRLSFRPANGYGAPQCPRWTHTPTPCLPTPQRRPVRERWQALRLLPEASQRLPGVLFQFFGLVGVVQDELPGGPVVVLLLANSSPVVLQQAPRHTLRDGS